MKEGEILKIRAERFLETARDLYKKEYYDLCAFNIEQAIQLFLKYEICNLDFYIENIYLPAQPSKEQTDLMFKFVEDLLNIFKRKL